MINEFVQPKEEIPLEGKEKVANGQASRLMDHSELSLCLSLSSFSESTNSSSSESEANHCRKRKHTCDEPMTRPSIDPQLNAPLSLDWEKCLDLQSGRMYYLNRKTLKKSWIRPRDQKLDLDLNISGHPTSSEARAATQEGPKKQNNSTGNMVAVACVNCHLLVMFYRSSPSCPNCKFVHQLPPPLQPMPHQNEPVKSLETLSLLH